MFVSLTLCSHVFALYAGYDLGLSRSSHLLLTCGPRRQSSSAADLACDVQAVNVRPGTPLSQRQSHLEVVRQRILHEDVHEQQAAGLQPCRNPPHQLLNRRTPVCIIMGPCTGLWQVGSMRHCQAKDRHASVHVLCV